VYGYGLASKEERVRVFLIIVAYLLGSIPFGLLIGWAAGKDVRREGSGNIGFTNVLRVCGVGWGLSVLILDVAKGFLAVALLADPDGNNLTEALCGGAVILGHVFPVWLGFRGGKGVATSAGVLAILAPVPLLVALIVWGLTVWVTRYISAGSILAAVVIVVAQLVHRSGSAFAPQTLPTTILVLVLAAVVILRHHANIRRLLSGTENRLGASRTDPASGDSDTEQRSTTE
jgi:glycerol-3-phosphate acyltransferase PlsY